VAAVLLWGAGSAQASPLPDLGLKITVSGTFSDSTVIPTTILYDKDIHSGVPRDVHASPSALSGPPLFSDSYVLQGGDPFGGDTFDPFEETQADGHTTVGPDAAHMLDIITHYTAVAGFVPTVGPTGATDTGVLIVQNNTAFDFTAPISVSGLPGDGGALLSETFNGLIPSGGSISITVDPDSSNRGGLNPQVTPEPSSIVLWSASLASLGVGAWWRRRKQA
jgi:hypothetical protein